MRVSDKEVVRPAPSVTLPGTWCAVLMTTSILPCMTIAQCGLSLGAPRAEYVGGAPNAMVVADFNGDGHQDIASVIIWYGDGDAGAVALLRGHGDGTFEPAMVTFPGGRPWALAAGDFNGDQYPDLAVLAGQLSQSGWILLGDGTGGFLAPIPLQVPAGDSGWPECIASGDFDRDGRDDLAVTSFRSGVSTLFSDGHGTFGRIRHEYLTEDETPSVCLGDFSGDGRPDLAMGVGSAALGPVAIQLDVAGGGIWRGVEVPSVLYPCPIGAIDIDLDGRDDLAIVTSGASVSVVQSLGQSRFGEPTTYPVPSVGGFVRSGRFDGDALPDLLVPSGSGLFVLLNDGHAHFEPAQSIGPTGYARWAIGDFNEDGAVDVAACDYASPSIAVLLNTTLQITRNPIGAQTCPSGEGVFGVSASGADLSYQWQREVSPFTMVFQDVNDGSSESWDGGVGGAEVEGANSGILRIRANASRSGRLAEQHAVRYRCVVEGGVCGVAVTAPAQLSVCEADQTCDGFLDFFDYDDFVIRYEVGDPAADFNADGFLDFFDYDGFVGAFEQGC